MRSAQKMGRLIDADSLYGRRRINALGHPCTMRSLQRISVSAK